MRSRDAPLQRARPTRSGSLPIALVRTDRSRIADLRRGRLERFSLETLLRLLDRAGMQVELRLTPRSFGRRRT